MTDTERASKLFQLLEAMGPDIDWASVPELTPEQTQLVAVLIEQQVAYAMDEGMTLAAEMIRLSPPHLSKDEIADLIESSMNDSKGKLEQQFPSNRGSESSLSDFGPNDMPLG
jgi:hypothetical protein